MGVRRDTLTKPRSFFENLDFFVTDKAFTDVVIVPTDSIHDSGYRCMKYVLINAKGKIVGVVGGGSDAFHLYNIYEGCEKQYAWCIDCLPESGLIHIWDNIRFWNKNGFSLPDFIGSDFYVIRND